MKNSKIIFTINVILLSSLLIVIGYLNFNRLVISVDTDYIAELNYGKLVWETKSIFPSTWVYGNELAFFRPALLFAAVYGLLGENYMLSGSITLCINVTIILFSLVYLLRGLNFCKENILCGCLLLLSFGGFEGRNFAILTVLYYGYYGFYLAMVFFTLGVLERIHQRKKVGIFVIYPLYVLTLLLGIVGIRMTMYLYFPIFTIALLNYFYSKLFNGDRKICFEIYKYTGIICIIHCIGFLIGRLISKDQNMATSVLAGIEWSEFSELPTIAWGNIVALVELLVGTTGGFSCFTIESLDMFVRILFLAYVLYLGVINRKFLIQKWSIACLLLSHVFILIIVTITNFGNGISFYYFLVPCTILLIVLLILELTIVKQKKLYVLTMCMVYTFVLSNIFLYYGTQLVKNDQDENVVELVEWLNNNDINKINMSFWNAGPVESHSNGNIKVAYFLPDDETRNDLYYFEWLNNLNNYNYSNEELIIVLSKQEEVRILNNEDSVLNLYENEKLTELSDYSIYRIQENPYQKFLLPDVGEEQLYRVNQFVCLNSVQLDGNVLQSLGESGYILVGPYIDVEEGNYTFSIDYNIIENQGDKVGFIDISCDSGSEVYATEKILYTETKGSSSIQNVTISEASNVEFRIYVEEGVILEISKISIVRER